MKTKGAILFVAVAGMFVAGSGRLWAHHGNAGYEMEKMTVIKPVTIVDFNWSNPHCQIHFDSTDDKGNVVHWDVEAPPPTMLVERGWSRKSVKPGDMVTVYFHAAKNGTPVGILQKFVMPDGSTIFAYPDPPAAGATPDAGAPK